MKFKRGISDCGLKESLLMFLDLAEKFSGREFFITSAYREGDDGAHGEGMAVDIRASGSRERCHVLMALTDAGFRRIGIGKRHIHADRSLSRDQYVFWLEEDYNAKAKNG